MTDSSPTINKKAKRKHEQINVSPLNYAQAVKSINIQQQLEHSNQLNIRLMEQLALKDIHINQLLEIINKFQNGQMNQPSEVKINKQKCSNVSSSNENSSRSVVVTNLPEQNSSDNDADKLSIEALVKNIDQSVVVESVKRMGKKIQSKTRPIKVQLKSTEDKKIILSKARDYIKSNQVLRERKTFINNYLSPHQLQHQMDLKSKLMEARKLAKEKNSGQKYFIKKNKVCVSDPPKQREQIETNQSKCSSEPSYQSQIHSNGQLSSPRYKIIEDFFGKPVILFYDPHSSRTVLGGYRHATQEEIEQMEK